MGGSEGRKNAFSASFAGRGRVAGGARSPARQVMGLYDPLNERDWIYGQMTDTGKIASSMTLERAGSAETDWTSAFDIVVPWNA